MRAWIKALVLASAVMPAFMGPALAQAQPSKPVPLVEPATVKGLIAAGGKITLVDVREPSEFAEDHLPGATLIPLGSLAERYTSLPKTGKLIVYCRSGRRSAQAVRFLEEHGYSNAVSMNGGILAWQKP